MKVQVRQCTGVDMFERPVIHMAAVKRRCTANPDLHLESIFIHLQDESRRLNMACTQSLKLLHHEQLYLVQYRLTEQAHNQDCLFWNVFDSNSSDISSVGSERCFQPHSLDHLFKGDGKQALLGCFPSLISSTHSNGMCISCSDDGPGASGQGFEINAHLYMVGRLGGHVLHTPTLSQRPSHHPRCIIVFNFVAVARPVVIISC
ncbi:hypothetical protein AUEXF2481DRAFT_457859 [Aureobasidium subglaciale EXF-2481]|uniref:Uncharacterized protein n=1 Tax=Aureobasidium subglaciale (strain EXF-2481) TaxID=1043005 RepID=A0A074Y1M0_AURSE|nr:uncharacterized protein AUEXF2481DRAFT_457859 [Aureobasidium subglaciale EXF-2481]KEQ91688.1 hypothetical protein AUEXF2481DRAFT_457859 [Aureobasidium subglaciale EXF-2481]